MLQRAFPGLLVLALLGCEGPDVPNAPPLQSGPASNTLFTPAAEEGGMDATAIAKAVCAKLIGCLGGEALEASCMNEMVRYTTFVIDGQSFVACFTGISCQSLQQYSKIDDHIEGCLDLDPSSVSCNGNAVHYCNRQGLCKDVLCSDFCKLVNQQASGARCVMRNDGPACDCGEWDRLPGG